MMKRKLAFSLMIIGAALVIGAASLFLYNRWDENRAAQAALETAQVLTQWIEAQARTGDAPAAQDAALPGPAAAGAPGQEAPPLPTVTLDSERYIGVLHIPALELSLPVMEGWSYARLKHSPCRYTGDPREDNLVIMAHNYSQHFGNISRLYPDDLVTFTDAQGLEHVYRVADIETVNATDIVGMVENEYDLTLFTCTYGGQARVAVRCVRV